MTRGGLNYMSVWFSSTWMHTCGEHKQCICGKLFFFLSRVTLKRPIWPIVHCIVRVIGNLPLGEFGIYEIRAANKEFSWWCLKIYISCNVFHFSLIWEGTVEERKGSTRNQPISTRKQKKSLENDSRLPMVGGDISGCWLWWVIAVGVSSDWQ